MHVVHIHEGKTHTHKMMSLLEHMGGYQGKGIGNESGCLMGMEFPCRMKKMLYKIVIGTPQYECTNCPL